MHKEIVIDLNDLSSFDRAKEEIAKIQKEIDEKTKLVIEKLSDIGIEYAKRHVGDEYEKYIGFSKVITDNGKQYELVVQAENIDTLVREWVLKDGTTKSAVVNAVTMNEVGSGWFADNQDGLPNAGQGTFPNQKHANDANGWYWKTADDVKHHSYGENGNLTMHYAYITMCNQIDNVIREVFK